MACSISLYPDNSIMCEVTVTNPKASPIYVNDATVTVTMKDSAGVEVTGQTWPFTLSYVATSNGIYRNTLNPISGVVAGERYKIEIDVTGTDSLVGHWEELVVAETKRCDN